MSPDTPDLITDADTSRGLGCTRPGLGRWTMQPDVRRRRISRRESIERQLVLDGIDPRPSETWEGREWLRLRRRFGAARVLKHATAISKALKNTH